MPAPSSIGREQLLAKGAATQSRVDQARDPVRTCSPTSSSPRKPDRAVIEQQATEGKVLAPVAGRVLSVPVTKGSVVLSGEDIARVAGGGYFLRLALPERHAAEIKEGDTVSVGRRVLSPAGGAGTAQVATGSWSRSIRRSPTAASLPMSRSAASATISSASGRWSGYRSASGACSAIPPAAVRTVHGVDYVSIAGGSGGRSTSPSSWARHSPATDGDRVEILSGLEPGDRVIVP